MTEAQTATRSLEAAFTKVWCERMNGVPILNPHLHVEAVGSREWNGHWLSVLITPWFINLMLLPQHGDVVPNWFMLRTGEKVTHRFPAGRFDFIAGDEGELGRYLMCSLFSPVLEFENQEAARVAAASALEALFDASLDPDREAQRQSDAAERVPSSPGAQTPAAPGPMSRRNLLSGRITSSTPTEGGAG